MHIKANAIVAANFVCAGTMTIIADTFFCSVLLKIFIFGRYQYGAESIQRAALSVNEIFGLKTVITFTWLSHINTSSDSILTNFLSYFLGQVLLLYFVYQIATFLYFVMDLYFHSTVCLPLLIYDSGLNRYDVSYSQSRVFWFPILVCPVGVISMPRSDSLGHLVSMQCFLCLGSEPGFFRKSEENRNERYNHTPYIQDLKIDSSSSMITALLCFRHAAFAPFHSHCWVF